MVITLIFSMGDTESLLATETGQPFIQLFYNSTQSLGGASAMTAIVVFMLSACCISEVATASRQLWSFARDKGLPFSDFLSVVSSNAPRHSDIADLSLGTTRLEFASTLRCSVSGHHFTVSLYQLGFCDSSQRHQLIRRSVSPHILHRHHRLPDLETIIWSPSAASPMVTGSFRTCHQYRSNLLHPASVVLCILATCYTCDGRNDELFADNVWSCHHIRSRVVVCPGAVCV